MVPLLSALLTHDMTSFMSGRPPLEHKEKEWQSDEEEVSVDWNSPHQGSVGMPVSRRHLRKGKDEKILVSTFKGDWWVLDGWMECRCMASYISIAVTSARGSDVLESSGILESPAKTLSSMAFPYRASYVMIYRRATRRATKRATKRATARHLILLLE